MYCKKCGKLLDADDRFCSKCGARVEKEFIPAFKQQDEASGEISDEKLRRQRTPERFNWDLDGYPTDQKKTEAIDFNWDSVLEEKQRNLFARELAQSELRAASAAEETEELPAEDAEATAEPESFGSAEAVEQDRLFAEMSASEAEEPTRVMDRGAGKAEGIDKFYTFNQKNAAFQALLDQEYERIQSGQDFVPSFIAEKEAEAAPEEPPKTDCDSRHEEFDWTLPGDKAFSEAVKKETEEPQLWWETDSKAPEMEEPQAPAEVSDQSLEDAYIGVELTRTPESYLALNQQKEMSHQAAGTGFAEAEKLPADEVPTLEELAPEEGEAAHGQFPPSRTAQKKAEEDKSRLTFYDVFGADDDDDASAEEPKKKGRALKIIAIFLCIFIVLDLAAIGILHFAPDSEAGKIIDKGYQRILGIFTGESQMEEPPQEPVEQLGETARLIEMKKSLGVNIATCEEDTTLLFEDGKDYGFEGFSNTYTFANKPWYTDDEGNSVTYGEEIISTVIQFYSAWVDKINGKNDDILDFVDETSDLYAEMQELQETEGVSYGINKLSIGDIRTGGAGFYVYVSVVKVDSDAGKEFTEKQILYMEPVNKTMQIVEIRTI
ncbi:MAG: zinc ribbon domain-containing protein [Emergencia sp.]|nr:zinc ribbon domain-containing protein [Emergencia sp.]